jgi:signal peptidase I
LKEDQFFMLGDNSANSQDGRLWGVYGRREEGYSKGYWVSRELLIGKALFIYWPHSWDRTPYVNIPCPYFPNFSRMGLIR